MKVTAQYAQEHFGEILATAERGEEVEIGSEGKPTYKLFLVSQPAQPRGKRILGAGVGELTVPSIEEWKAMDKELEELMLDGPLFPGAKK